jgi:hypothetical protein
VLHFPVNCDEIHLNNICYILISSRTLMQKYLYYSFKIVVIIAPNEIYKTFCQVSCTTVLSDQKPFSILICYLYTIFLLIVMKYIWIIIVTYLSHPGPWFDQCKVFFNDKFKDTKKKLYRYLTIANFYNHVLIIILVII